MQGDSPKESAQKSKEQLEEEKRAILAQRITALSVDGLNAAGLVEKAKELHDKLLSLAHQKYDLEERFKRQQYDVSFFTNKMKTIKTRCRDLPSMKGSENALLNISKWTEMCSLIENALLN